MLGMPDPFDNANRLLDLIQSHRVTATGKLPEGSCGRWDAIAGRTDYAESASGGC